MLTQADLETDLQALGVKPKSCVMVHTSLRKIGPLLNGPQTLLDALLNHLTPQGTLLVYTDWHANYDAILDAQGRVPDPYRGEILAYDPTTSSAASYLGFFAEWVRRDPRAWRSNNPGAACAAIGKNAESLTANHALNWGYGPSSPFAKLIELAGDIVLLGAPKDTVTLLHHAEHLANIPNKRIRKIEVPMILNGAKTWHMINEFDTGDPVSSIFAADYFGEIVSEFLANHHDGAPGQSAPFGQTTALRLPAKSLNAFGIKWMEQKARAANR